MRIFHLDHGCNSKNASMNKNQILRYLVPFKFQQKQMSLITHKTATQIMGI